MAKKKRIDVVNPSVAGIDIGAKSNFVAVDPSLDPQPVCEFSTFTDDLKKFADWLKSLKITTVVMEATGVYWITLFSYLETRNFTVTLVNPRYVKTVPGRKSDVKYCQWLQQLHSFGLLLGSFIPPQEITALRGFVRQRETLIRYASSHINHMSKALIQMNVLLNRVVSNIIGVTGMAIIKAILDGERDPYKLASLRDGRCKMSEKEIARALEGIYREEHLFALK